jgi:DNA recombination-dependent growth factor C
MHADMQISGSLLSTCRGRWNEDVRLIHGMLKTKHLELIHGMMRDDERILPGTVVRSSLFATVTETSDNATPRRSSPVQRRAEAWKTGPRSHGAYADVHPHVG